MRCPDCRLVTDSARDAAVDPAAAAELRTSCCGADPHGARYFDARDRELDGDPASARFGQPVLQAAS